jgi:OFA family oxalate/formate antiporter-like MFS transporter
LVSLGFFLCSYTHSLTYLIVCFGVIGGLGNGFGYSTPIPVMAKWFPDKRGLAVGLAVAGYGGGSAIFGPLANLKLIPAYGVHTTFQILGGIFLVMTVFGAFLLRNPPVGYKPPGWTPAPASKSAATTYEFSPSETLRTPAFYLMWIAYALGTSAGLMVISQLVPFAKSVHVSSAALATMGLVVGAAGNALGRILSGWMSDAVHSGVRRVLVLRNAALGEWLHLFGFLGNEECRPQLRNALHRMGRGWHHWSQDRRVGVRQVQELPDGVLLGGGFSGSCPALRTGG